MSVEQLHSRWQMRRVFARMAAATMTDREPRDILRLKRCPRCSYDLAGLPRNHACPECGFRYDELTFRLDVGGTKLKLQRSIEALYFAFMAGLAVLYAWFSGRRTPTQFIWAMLLLALATLSMPMVVSLVYRMRGRMERPGTLTVIFDSTGFTTVGERRRAGHIAYSTVCDVDIAKRPWHRAYHVKILVPVVAGLRMAWIRGTLDISRDEAAILRDELARRIREAKSLVPARASDRARP